MAEPAASLPASTKLAFDRTLLAHDRTLLAWVRTSTSLISFGFTIHKFFQYLRESGEAAPAGWLGPREFALLMMGIGVLVLVLATIEHRRRVKELRTEYRELPYSLATVLAALIGFLGIAGLLAAWFHY